MWKEITATYPEQGVIVLTKIKDEFGERNEQRLKRIKNLWWHPDGSMYVYYTPTHYLQGSEKYSLNLSDYIV